MLVTCGNKMLPGIFLDDESQDRISPHNYDIFFHIVM